MHKTLNEKTQERVGVSHYVQETAHTSFNQNIGKMVPFPANLSWSVSLVYDRNEKLLKTLQTLYPISLNMTFNSIIIKLLFSTYGNSLYCLIQALICKRLLPWIDIPVVCNNEDI